MEKTKKIPSTRKRSGFIRFNVLIELLQLNSCTTVEADWRQCVNTTLSLALDVSLINTKLNELSSNSLSTLLRELLVEVSLTSLAVSVTLNDDLSVVSLSSLSDSLNSYEILLRSNLRLANVEEY